MPQVDSNQEVFGQPAKYWKGYSFCSTNEMFANSVKDKLVSYLKKNTDYNDLSKREQENLVMSSVRAIRIELNAFPKALQKQAA